jgi:transposase
VVRDWSGAALPASLQQRLAHAQARLALLEAQIAELEQQQRAGVAEADAATGLARLVQLKGIATTSASVLVDEGLLWRAFRNRREVGGLLGFRPVPHQSGDAARDVGIDRAGNKRWRSIMVQLAWGWLHWQPMSALTQWYQRRFAEGGSRARRIGIVALARKLFIALWRYATTGVAPEGAIVKVA